MNTNSRFVHIMLESNAWATGVLIDACKGLSDEQFHLPFEIGPGSIHNTLRHIIGAMLRWADRIGRRSVRPSIESNPQPLSVSALRAELDRAAAELTEVSRQITAADAWDEQIEFAIPNGPSHRFSRAAALVHVITHGAHHRAQVLNMLRRLGRPSLGVDLDVVEWECVSTGQLESPRF